MARAHPLAHTLWLLAGLSGLSGCSYDFGTATQALPLTGTPPDMSRLPRLNRAPADDAYVIYGEGGKRWVAILEPGSLIRLRRLDDPAIEDTLSGDRVQIDWGAFYIIDPNPADTATVTLTIRSAGQPPPYEQYTLPSGDAVLQASGDEEVFLYWVQSEATKTFDLVRRDTQFRRAIPVPDGVDPTSPLGAGGFFDYCTTAYLYVRDGKGQVTAYSTTDTDDHRLGKLAEDFSFFDCSHFLTCGDDGLRVVGLKDRVAHPDGSLDKVLDPDPCTPGQQWEHDHELYYLVGDQMRAVPYDGSSKPRVVFDKTGKQILTFAPDARPVFSTNPPHTYAADASDGWLGGWEFMQRGRDPRFSADGKRLRFLEHAANLVGSGDLMSAPVGGEATLLAENVRVFAELGDGRILAVANYAFWGTHNRIIVLDEDKGVAQWVADSSSAFTWTDQPAEILVYVTRSTGAFDVVLMTLPPKLK